MSKKKCNNCENRHDENHSVEWSVSAEIAKRNRQLWVIILIIAFLWAASIPLVASVASGELFYELHNHNTETQQKQYSDEDKGMKNFFNDEWETFIAHCGFTDAELEVVALLRRGWYEEDIAAETLTSRSTVKRRKKSITLKISHYLVNNA